MKIITGFDEAFEESSKPQEPPLQEYGHIVEALKHDVTIAENAFARAAKKELKRMLTKHSDTAVMRKASECQDLSVIWVQELSVTLNPTSSVPGFISHLVNVLARSVMETVKDEIAVFIDPLQVHILHIGETLYTFRLKQKWSKKPA